MDVFWAAPPVTRTLTALTLVQSALMYGGLLGFYWAPFLPSLIFSWRPQIYRLVTPFLLTGPKLGFFFDLYIMYHYGSAAEKSMAPGEFLIYLLFVAFSIMLRNLAESVPEGEGKHPASVQHHHNSQNTGVVQLTAGGYLGAAILLSPLTMAFVYTFSQTNRGTKTRFWFIDIPVVFLPYAMLLVTMVSNGWDAALVESTGILAAHTYDFLTRIYPTFGADTEDMEPQAAHQGRLGNPRQRQRQDQPGAAGPLRVLGMAEALAGDSVKWRAIHALRTSPPCMGNTLHVTGVSAFIVPIWHMDL
ncbi:hypothetical protein N7524_012457 [Penicillium chrysogenum]|nr:hypothetical protein N7524_012457 [Penicillium chrysogenum]